MYTFLGFSCTGISIQAAASNGLSFGRSGNAMVVPANEAPLKATTVFVDHSGKAFVNKASLDQINSVEISVSGLYSPEFLFYLLFSCS